MQFSMDHTPFIVASYAVFAVLLAADFIGALRARRRVLDDLRGRGRREARRHARAPLSGDTDSSSEQATPP
jgi:heme exporter protein CcmD